MWVFNVIFLLFPLAGYLFCRRKTEDWMQSPDKKEHNLYLLYPFCNWLLIRTGLYRRLSKKTDVTNAIKALYITSKPDNLNKLFWCKRLSQVLVVLVLFNLLSLLGFGLEQSNSTLMNGRYVERPGYGEGSKNTRLEVTIENTEEVKEKDGTLQEKQEVTVGIDEQQYKEEEVEELFGQAKDYLNKEVLGENESLDNICYPLKLINEIPGTSIQIKWFPQDYSLIKSDGSVCNEEIDNEGVLTSVKALLIYYDYKNDLTLQLKIMPKHYSANELFTRDLSKAIQDSAEKTATDRLFELPETLGKYKLSWKSADNSNGASLLLIGILLAGFLWFYGDKEIDRRMKKRKQQMLSDYPEIINKFTLLINAGMTLRQAWYKISEDYAEKSSQKGFIKHYAYEEMLATVRELKLGIPESTAYEQYGRRTGLIPYIKFSTLISQNLKKGTKGFTQLLMLEATEAFEERKETAKRLGEEAGTKLLFPMMIMLMIVFLIIMIPAFATFSI